MPGSFAWKNVTLRNVISPKLKKSEPLSSKINICYKFTCPCSKIYIGETKKRLLSRAREHQQPSRDTEICHHILHDCDTYKDIEMSSIGPNPRRTQKFEYFLGHFELIGCNLNNTYMRKIHEAFQILLNVPELNKQMKSYTVSLK